MHQRLRDDTLPSGLDTADEAEVIQALLRERHLSAVPQEDPEEALWQRRWLR